MLPNVAVMQQLPQTEFDLFYVGGTADEPLLQSVAHKTVFYPLTAPKLQRGKLWANLSVPVRLFQSYRKAFQILKTVQPQLIFSKGGYVSLPVCLAARRLRIPFWLHESDRSMGLANRICARFAQRVFCCFPLSKGECVGALLRQEYATASALRGRSIAHASGTRPLLCVMGGSTGATALNRFVYRNLPQLTERFDVFLVCGKGKRTDITMPHFFQTEFCPALSDVLAASDFVLSRAGANAACELVAMQKLCVLVPLKKATRGEQAQNAAYFAQRGCLLSLDEDELSVAALYALFDTLAAKADTFRKNCDATAADGTGIVARAIREQCQD